MDAEDLEPQHKPVPPKDLEPLSLEELRDYIAAMQAEIARAQAMIDAKSDHRSTAESVFKS
jgi:uncharacterized small protein (DUF1192 family)